VRTKCGRRAAARSSTSRPSRKQRIGQGQPWLFGHQGRRRSADARARDRVAQFGIRVTAVAPLRGGHRTVRRGPPTSWRSPVTRPLLTTSGGIPMGRAARPDEDIASPIVFLASDAAPMVSGSVFAGRRRQPGPERRRLDRRVGRQARYVALRLAATVLVRVPMPDISISTTSPGCRKIGVSRNAPTPDGVPVAMMSAGLERRAPTDVGDQLGHREDHVS